MQASAIEEVAWESFEVHAGMSGGSPDRRSPACSAYAGSCSRRVRSGPSAARLSSRGSNGVDGATPHGSGALVAGA